MTVPSVTYVTLSHGNVRFGPDGPAGAADDPDVPAAAMLQARSIGSALASSRSSARVRHSRPSCSRPMAAAAAPLSKQRRDALVPGGAHRQWSHVMDRPVTHAQAGHACCQGVIALLRGRFSPSLSLPFRPAARKARSQGPAHAAPRPSPPRVRTAPRAPRPAAQPSPPTHTLQLPASHNLRCRSGMCIKIYAARQ